MIHCGTNNLNSDDTHEKVSSDINHLGKVVKTEKDDAAVSGICPRRDRFNQKAK